MDARKQRFKQNSICPPSPLPNIQSSTGSIFKDISNFKTPKSRSKTLNFNSSPCSQQPHFFTASKNTPAFSGSSSRRPGLKSSVLKSKAAKRLKVFEVEQSKSARKAQIEREKSVKSLAKSLAVWLNFLFENPESCGCNVSRFAGEFERSRKSSGAQEVLGNGKSDSGAGRGVGVDGQWRDPKRPRNFSWVGAAAEENREITDSMFTSLRNSLKEICSFDDLKERMRNYLSLASCKEIFGTMSQVAKNIDEGRVKMRVNCPIVSDVGMKEKAVRILMCYNPIWLRIGLYIILGGDSLLPNGDINSEQEIAFLRMVIEKQFFSHAGLAKTYAYNKLVEGLYRPGYYENLGNVILKRFLLLVLILDRAKAQTSLPLKYGIDGLDGGSPLLFSLQSNIKSSRQLINDFLSCDVMHGEGNLLAHLVIVGYKVTCQQSPLVEYNFKVTDLFEDLQDGVRLCRAIQLLKHDPSILTKVVVPSDTRKKSLVNSGVALQYLKEAGVPLLDEDGTAIIVEDVVNGDKELILSLLWNMFVHLQLPLLISRTLLLDEISKIGGDVVDSSSTKTLMGLLLNWVQEICESYDLKVEGYSSLLDGRAMWCLLDYYFRKEHDCPCSSENLDGTKKEISIMLAIEYTDAVHNFILSQKLTSLLGNFPEVLQVSDILEHNGACNDRSVVVLLVFLSFQLLVKRNTDKLNFHKLFGFKCQSPDRRCLRPEKLFMHSEAALNREGNLNSEEDTTRSFKAIMSWWQDMAQRNSKSILWQISPNTQCLVTNRRDITFQRGNAATIIQSHFKRKLAHQKYLKTKDAIVVLQRFIRAWLFVKNKSSLRKLKARNDWLSLFSRAKNPESLRPYISLMVDRHYFVSLKKSVIVIQWNTRNWISQRLCSRSTIFEGQSLPVLRSAAIVIQGSIRVWIARSLFVQRITRKNIDLYKGNGVSNIHVEAASTIQCPWRGFVVHKSLQRQHYAATKIQSYYRGCMMRKSFAEKKEAAITIQSLFQYFRHLRKYQIYRQENLSAITIQSHVRGWMARREVYREKCLIIMIQSYCRGWLQKKEFMLQKVAAGRIQRSYRSLMLHNAFLSYRHAAIQIQRFIRGENTRKQHLGQRNFMQSILKLQRWWRDVLLLRGKAKSAVVIQSHFRGWIARQTAVREKRSIVVIQSYWKGYLARKGSRGQLLDLRLRMQKSAANVDDSMRLINRLTAALSELLNMRSVSGILHTCATLDLATEHSQKCCEELVAAGAVGTLLKVIRSVSRSIPDQQILKHALSTLRNLARYPHITELLIESHGSVETILWEFLRNKEEGCLIASELLKKILMNKKGVKAAHKSPALLRRLYNLAEDLTRKAGNDRRNTRGTLARELAERRLREAVQLVELISKV